jgi:hypothetical protein
MRPTAIALVGLPILAASSSVALAQPRGVLRPDGARVQAAAARETIFGGSATDAEIRTLALIVFDPSLTTAQRSSANAGTIVIHDAKAKEVKLQLNLCDLWCPSDAHAISVTFAAPLDEKAKFQELATLDGLVGDSRMEATFTNDIARMKGRSLAFSYTLAASAARPNFAWREAVTLVESKQTRTPYALNGGIGRRWVRDASGFSLYGGYRYEQVHKAQPAQSICTPTSAAPPGSLSCAEMRIGAPVGRIQTVLTLEARAAFRASLATVLRFSQDVRNDVSAIAVPIYLFRNEKGDLGGGVQFQHRSDVANPTLGIFISLFEL